MNVNGIEYRVFDHEKVKVAEGDLFWNPVGGFTIQPTRVFEVNAGGFKYRNDRYVSTQSSKDSLDGILERVEEGRIVRYVSEGVFASLKKLSKDDKS